jgi:hypothetical protein
MKRKLRKKPTQKHVKHTLHLLAQQESAFLDRSIRRAENERTEIAKRDTTNKMRISANSNPKLPSHTVGWKQQTRNITANLQSNLRRAVKQAARTFTATKSVTFAPTRTVRTFNTMDEAIMITYDSGADRTYMAEKDRQAIRAPIL